MFSNFHGPRKDYQGDERLKALQEVAHLVRTKRVTIGPCVEKCPCSIQECRIRASRVHTMETRTGMNIRSPLCPEHSAIHRKRLPDIYFPGRSKVMLYLTRKIVVY
jgi:hypothetical protein